MGAPDADPAAMTPPSSGSLKPYSAGFWFGGFNGLTWMVSLGTPMVLLAERLGASTFQVGLASSFVFMLMPLQLIATTFLPRFGYKRQMVACWLLRAVFLLIPFWLAWQAPETPAPWMPALLVASVFGFCFFRAIGAVAHIPWFSGFLPVALRGRFFATDSAITSAVGVFTLLGCAQLFAWMPGYGAFQVLYALAFGGSLAAVWNLTRLPSTPAPEATPLRALFAKARHLCFHPGLFRHYLLLMLATFVVTSSFAAFTVYYLKVEAGLSDSAIMLLTAAQFAGQISGTWSIRKWIDQVPLRRFFQLAGLLIGAVDAFWLVFIHRNPGAGGEDPIAMAGLALAFLVFGAGSGIISATHATYLPELTPVHQRHIGVAVFTAVHGLLAGLAPTLWGLLLRKSGDTPGIDTASFAIYFATGLAVAALVVVLFARLPETRPQPAAID